MKIRFLIIASLLASSANLMAQKWEFGTGLGAGISSTKKIENPRGDADTKFGTGVSASAWIANNVNERWGGEFRYNYRVGDMELKSGSAKATFASQAQSVHYDFHYHFANTDTMVRPFVGFGAGIKMFRGTGTEVAAQPLSNVALLTKTNDMRPMVSLAAGAKVKMNDRWGFRVEFHDFLTQFPSKIITPNVGSKVGGWMHDYVPVFGISYLF